MIHLKTKPVAGKTQRFAVLFEPDYVPTPKMSAQENDECLYAACKLHGKVIIHEFEDDNPFRLKRNATHLTPEQFESEWIGD